MLQINKKVNLTQTGKKVSLKPQFTELLHTHEGLGGEINKMQRKQEIKKGN